jgi:hypothetical protein
MLARILSPESKKRYAIAYNTVGLFASQNVIECLHRYQEITRLPPEQVSLGEHDKLLTKLVLAIRSDLKLKPNDDKATFSYKLIASYADEKTYEHRRKKSPNIL